MSDALPRLSIEFAGELVTVHGDAAFTIGRTGDLVLDDNPYLHRRFLVVSFADGMWWLENVGSRLAASLSDDSGGFSGRLAPGARLPIPFDRLHVEFAAGPTTYDFTILAGDPRGRSGEPGPEPHGDTIGTVPFSPAQRLLIVALAEPALRRSGSGALDVPSSAAAAARLGWTLPAFTRRLDLVCEKLERSGVSGLRGGRRGGLAVDRRRRLVDHAIGSGLVTRADLALLDGTS